MSKFESMRILFKIRIWIATTGDEITDVEFVTHHRRVGQAQHFIERYDIAVLLGFDVVVVIRKPHSCIAHTSADCIESLRAPSPILKFDVLEWIAGCRLARGRRSSGFDRWDGGDHVRSEERRV